MNIFLETSYRVILRRFVEERKSIDGKFNFQAIAEATRIPKSYFSKVTTEKAHFSADQLFVVCELLGFTQKQSRYLTTLMEWERSVHMKRRSILSQEIQDMRDEALDSKEHLKAKPESLDETSLREYYIDPLHQVVHICLSISRYQSDPQKLANDLAISVSELRQIIERLERLGVIEQHNGRIRTVIKNIHLSRSSPAYKPWRNQLKLLCMEQLNRYPRKEVYSFSVTFSATERVREQIKGEFLEMLKSIEERVQNSKQEQAYQMSFDLFSWTTNKQ
jgi:uncharacterized protein (TIGR02147 family)